MDERMIRADGVELCAEAFGNPADPPVLLIMGLMASMLWWPEELCHRLAGHQRYVIRYDNRDTGRSTTYPPGEPGYTLDDMADDAARILDGYGIPRAHLVGASLGGMIGQLVALKHPARVASFTAISSSPFDSDIHGGPDRGGEAEQTNAAGPDLTDREQTIAFMVEGSRRLAGSAFPFDEDGIRRLVERDFDRARNYQSSLNHMLLTGGEAWRGRLREIRAPLLVIHGTEDPLFPPSEGAKLAAAVGNTPVIQIAGMGHDLPEPAWDPIIAAIVDHTDRARVDGDGR
jgi:pimeloyl-ACP methyl ester carboxylesterase